MVYDWEGKEDMCYRMYIEEKRSLEDIMEYMKNEHNFAPSKRAFQTQFKRWDFPSKQNPAHKNAPLVNRVHELWEHNTSQKDMLRILNEDGFDIKERELMRVRAKNRWLLRVPNGMKSVGKGSSPGTADQSALNEFEQVLFPADKRDELDDSRKEIMVPRELSPDLAPEVVAKRQERLQKLQQDSAERWASRKRRRRTRGWAGLPADPPGPPRFPSETTIDESKVFLSLNNELYRDIRDRFQMICEQAGFIKKTIAGPERWQAAKDRLIQESPHLQSVFWANNTQLDAKALALDVVCTDVTKRMRTLERRMTIAEAKNVLGVNPEESRDIRNAFYQTLKADHFTSKLEAGDDHWKELKEHWIQSSDLLKGLLASAESDPEHGTKVRAIEVLCRDVMKRLRDDQTKRDPSRKKQRADGPGPGPAPPHPALHFTQPQQHSLTQVQAQAQAQAQAEAHAQAQAHAQSQVGDLQIDPSLLMAANDPSLAMDQQQQQQQFAHSFAVGYPPAPSTSIPIFFRLSPMSQIPQGPRVWIETLHSVSVHELRHLATNKHPNTVIARIDGVVKDANNNEVMFTIDEDDELEAFLAHDNGGKATFSVHLMPSPPYA
ncbi:MAG: Vacuolar protein sorting-associated protein 62 [Chaenotheca gracillima]|nr:MAG: Vacuolar protein sorting-associated protein 62 [Chaenotheca gracillima]